MTIKEISITGGASNNPQVGGFKKRRGTRRSGGGDGGGAMAQVAAGSTGSSVSIAKLEGAAVPIGNETLRGMPLASFSAPIRGGSSLVAGPASPPVAEPPKEIKVELKKAAGGGAGGTHKRVHLNPKKDEAAKSGAAKKTHKNRKITLGLIGLQKRLTRAKKIQKKVKEMPIAELKSELIKRGLIKSTTKAPESVLRQIAADAHIVARQDL
jgi:hypothetical protein